MQILGQVLVTIFHISFTESMPFRNLVIFRQQHAECVTSTKSHSSWISLLTSVISNAYKSFAKKAMTLLSKILYRKKNNRKNGWTQVR